MKAFESYHPIILFVYFISLIFITMFTLNPILVGILFVGSVVFCGMLIGIRKLLSSLLYSIPTMIIIAITNPIFVHKGETILFFLNDNPVTLEAIIYGGVMSMMLMTMFYLFKCYNAVMTSDKFIYLFGRVIPKLSLMLSMAIAFIPKLKRHYKEIDNAQKTLGMYSEKGYIDKIRSKIRVLSILLTWSLENSVETADSMRAKGYGLKGRTSFSIFNWTGRDTIMSIIITILLSCICFLLSQGFGAFIYYPTISHFDFGALAIVLYVALFIMITMSTIIEIKENIVWRLLKSKI